MRWDEIKEQILGRLQAIWGEIQESTTYIQLKEKYDELPPRGQKAVNIGGLGLISLFVLILPLLAYFGSVSSMSDFEDTRLALRDLVRLGRLQAQTPNVPDAPTGAQIQTHVQTIITELHLIPEQVKENNPATFDPVAESALIPKGITQDGVQVTLVKLNLNQVLDMGHRFSMIPGVHLLGMDMKANAQDVHYFDVMFRLVGLKVVAPPVETKEPPKKS